MTQFKFGDEIQLGPYGTKRMYVGPVASGERRTHLLRNLLTGDVYQIFDISGYRPYQEAPVEGQVWRRKRGAIRYKVTEVTARHVLFVSLLTLYDPALDEPITFARTLPDFLQHFERVIDE